MTESENKKLSRGEKFILYLKNIADQKNSAKTAALKRADNPALEYQSWEILNRFGVDLNYQQERVIFSLIASAFIRNDKEGTLGIGAAIASCYPGKSKDDQANAKLRRLIACESVEELCHVLRPLLRFISSKGMYLHFGKLLNELLWFEKNSLETKSRWAQNFYGQPPEED